MFISPYKLGYGYLKPDELVRIYNKILEELGTCSLGRIREYCKRKGIVNPATGQPPSRQAIWYALQRTDEGRLLLNRASHTHYIKRPETGWPEERKERDRKRSLIQVPPV